MRNDKLPVGSAMNNSYSSSCFGAQLRELAGVATGCLGGELGVELLVNGCEWGGLRVVLNLNKSCAPLKRRLAQAAVFSVLEASVAAWHRG